MYVYSVIWREFAVESVPKLFATAELAFEYADLIAPRGPWSQSWIWSVEEDDPRSRSAYCTWNRGPAQDRMVSARPRPVSFVVRREIVDGFPSFSELTEAELDEATVALDAQRAMGIGGPRRPIAPLIELIRSIPSEQILGYISALPMDRIPEELDRSRFVGRLIRSLKSTPNAVTLTEQTVNGWFDDFSENVEFRYTEEMMLLLFALLRSGVALGVEYRESLSKTQRAEFGRLRRFAISLVQYLRDFELMED